MDHNECQQHIDLISSRLRKLAEANRSYIRRQIESSEIFQLLVVLVS
jgi:hypothetical protein